jgi:hypothetical protein
MRRLLLAVAAWLLALLPAAACTVCRPRVQAGIHNEAYAANLLLVLLPVALLLALGLGLFWAPAWQRRSSH